MNGGRIEYRAAKVSAVTGLSTILAVVFQLISVPICLKYWGKETYGSWLALFSAFLLLRSLDGGYTAYVGNKLNYLYHQNVAELREHLSSAAAGIVVIGSLQLILAAGTLILDPLATMLGMPAGHAGGLLTKFGLLLLVISWVLTGSYLGIVHRLLVPAGLMYQAAWWAMGFQVSQFGAIIVAAMLKLSMLQTSLLFALSQLTIYVTSALYIRLKLPGFFPWWHGASVRTGLNDLGQSFMLTASNVIQQCATNGIVLMVSALAGPVAVPAFTTVRTLTNLWTSVTTVLTAPLLPEVVRFHAKGQPGKLMAMNEAFWVLVGSVVNWGALLSYPLIPYLYGRWTAHTVVFNQTLICLMLGSVVVSNAGALMALHLNGINSLRIVLGTSVARAVLGLGGGALWFRQLGLGSFGLGILAGELAATLMTGHYFVRHELTEKGLKMRWATLRPVALGTGSALLFFIGAGFGWWSTGWIWLIALTGVAVASAMGWNALDLDMRARLMDLMTRLIRR
jgi:O-antigen/teichoic acid export membrane protein